MGEERPEDTAVRQGGDVPGPERPRRRRRLIALGVVLAVVAVGGTVVAVRWVRGTARPVSLEDAHRPTGSTLPANPTVLRPPQGVYRYTGSGTDSLDKPPKSQAEGPEMPATVTHHADGCWTFRIDYSTNHWQSWDYCPHDGGLDERGGTTYQKWDFGVFVNESTSTFTCDAPTIEPDQEPGDTWQQSCTGTTTGSEGVARTVGPYRCLGPETLDIGGQEVEAYRYHRERTSSGSQSGGERSDVWFSAETGMPLRNERRVEARTSTIIGDVSYTEQAEFLLTSLRPAA
mgnify:CR=1 FL=1